MVRDLRSPRELRKWRRRFGEQVALEEVAPEVDERVALGRRLHALGDDRRANVVTERDHRRDDAALRAVRVDAANELHVELHDLGLEQREAREAGVARAEIVDGDTEPELAERA